MGLGGVAIAILPSIICLKLTFSDGLGGEIRTSVIFLDAFIYGYVQNYTAYCPKKCCIGGGGEMPVGDMN